MSTTFAHCHEHSACFQTNPSSLQVVANKEVGDAATYHCDTLRLMPLASIDPSLAIGFYCRSAGESVDVGDQSLTAMHMRSKYTGHPSPYQCTPSIVSCMQSRCGSCAASWRSWRSSPRGRRWCRSPRATPPQPPTGSTSRPPRPPAPARATTGSSCR